MSIALLSHPNCLLHNMGSSHPEQPARLQAINKALRTEALVPYLAPLPEEQALLRVHSKRHVQRIFKAAPEEGMICFAPDVYMNKYSLNAALRAAGAAAFAVDLVMNGEVEQAFCNIRP